MVECDGQHLPVARLYIPRETVITKRIVVDNNVGIVFFEVNVNVGIPYIPGNMTGLIAVRGIVVVVNPITIA